MGVGAALPRAHGRRRPTRDRAPARARAAPQGKGSLKRGKTSITGGTGAFHNLKGSGLSFTVTRDGTMGTVAIVGEAEYK